MKIMFKKLVLGLAMLGICSSAIHPMAPAAAKVTQSLVKEYLKKGIEKGATCLHWAIAAGPCWGFSAEGLSSYDRLKNNAKIFAEKFPDFVEAEEVPKKDAWIRQELKSQGYNDWETVEIISSSQFAATSCFNKKAILYDGPQVSEAFSEQNSALHRIKEYFGIAKSDSYNEMRGILSHEVGHLKNHHIEKGIMLGLTMPFITHALYKKMFGSIKTPAFINSNFGLRNSLKIMSGISNLAVNAFALWSFRYLAEKEADEGVINDTQVLEAVAQSMRKHAASKSTKQNIWQSQFESLVDPHPSPLNRAQRFEERAAQLRKLKV